MSESTDPAAPAASIKGWWIGWIVAVIAGPAVAISAIAARSIGEGSGAMGLAVGLLIFACFVAHIVTSIGLSRRIERRRNPEAPTGAIIGLTIGLLFGGWAAMFAVSFVGCLGAMTLG